MEEINHTRPEEQSSTRNLVSNAATLSDSSMIKNDDNSFNRSYVRANEVEYRVTPDISS